MKTLLEEAIEQLRELPDEEQNAAADEVFAYISDDARQYSLRPHVRLKSCSPCGSLPSLKVRDDRT